MSVRAGTGFREDGRAAGGRPEVSLFLSNLEARAALEVARAGEAAGISRAWIADTPHVDVGALGAVLAASTSLELGTGVIGVFTRSPASLACMISTWARLAGDGRALHLGLGAGGPVPVTRWHGAAFERPVEAVRDTVAIVRQALAGRRTAYDGATRGSHGFQLPGGAVPSARVCIGGLGPRMRALAAEVADGLILSWATPAGIRAAARGLARDLTRCGRPRGAVRLLARAYVDVCEDPTAVRSGVSAELVEYAMAPPYARFFAELGYADDVRAVAEAFARGDRRATCAAAARRMTDSFLLAGSPEEVRGRLGDLLDSGVDEVILQPVAAFRGGDPVRTVRELAGVPAGIRAVP
jgi:alkanesulfonate monooxygenase SsuD/methylene tetrahydromethanopterin reductase-like flavin-dependent oxidoreductase (luciferase family)